MNGRAWTTAEVAQMRALAPTHTAPQVAVSLGRSVTSINQQARRQGVRFRKHGESHHAAKYPNALISRAWAMKAWGKSTRVISEEVGIPFRYLRGILVQRKFRRYQTPEHRQPVSRAKAQVRTL